MPPKCDVPSPVLWLPARRSTAAHTLVFVDCCLVFDLSFNAPFVVFMYIRCDAVLNGASLFAAIVAQALLTTRTTCHNSHSADMPSPSSPFDWDCCFRSQNACKILFESEDTSLLYVPNFFHQELVGKIANGLENMMKDEEKLS